ncbi:hypothetical protein FACS1894199_11690 [Bacteroidia bacterium]|nr:hypothetical protein FACS1894199_11690 [Bacteroidia bacterium]
METITINKNSYKILGKRNQTIADSFVARNNKIGSGSGEAKLYIGNDDAALRNFYGAKGFENNCFLSKENLLKYLYDSKYEYYNPSQPYRFQSENDMYVLWEKLNSEAQNLSEVIKFAVCEQTQITPPRVYIKSNDSGYELIRNFSLPNLTDLSILKLQDTQENIIYCYQLNFRSSTIQIIEESENFEDEDEYVPVLDVEEEVEEYYPYDIEKISIEKKPLTMDTCLRRLVQGNIILNPDFQRNEVWTIEKKSRLIESLMLKIPIPMFYVSADENGVYSVVDGLQRLSTIRDFVLGKDYLATKDLSKKGNGFRLQKLEFWGSKYDNCNFNQLPVDIQDRILETEFTLTVINPSTPEEVKRNVFKRINTGGAPLTSQEIRNALYTGQSSQLLKELAKTKEFLEATDYSVKSGRMMEQELILRSIAFIVRNYLSYPKNNDMDNFLSDTMRIINIMSDFQSIEGIKFFKAENTKKDGVQINDIVEYEIVNLKKSFIQGMIRAKKIFGKHSFRKSYGNNRRTPINKSLFEVWTVLLANLSDSEYDILCKNKKQFHAEYNQLLDSYNFNYLISRDSLKYASIQERYKQLSQLLKNHTT